MHSLGYGVVIALLLVLGLRSWMAWWQQRSLDTKEATVPAVIPLAKGTIAGRPYVAVAETDGTLSAYVTLKQPLEFELHLHGSNGPFLHNSIEGLTRVALEGDFPDYFQVYCTPGCESRALELLDPADMAYLVDFCRNYDIIFDHESMVLSQPAHDGQDSTSVITDAEELLTRNKVFFENIEG